MSVGQFVDVEQLVIVWLTEQLPDVRVLHKPNAKLPKDLHGVIRVTRSPGGNDADTNLPRVDVECFAADRMRMWILAGRANNALAELCGDVVAIAVNEDGDELLEVQVDDVNTITDPVPGYWSPTVERSVAVYEFDVRTEF